MNTKRFLLTLLAILTVVLSACGTTDTATPAPDPVNVVQQYIQALNTKQLDTAMTFVADNAVYVNPYGKFEGRDQVRASLQLVINDGVTFEYNNFRESNGRVVYDYRVFVNGEEVEVGNDGLNVVRDGKITLDSTERWEWLAYTHTAAFTVEDSGFSGPDSIPAGWTEISLTNNSSGVHHFQLVKLLEGKTLDDLKAALVANSESFPAWAIAYGGPNAPDPTGTTSAIVNLDPGSYAIISVIPNADGVPGFLNGLLKALTVTEAQTAPALEPASDLTIDLTEFALGVSGSIAAGEHIIRINNAGLQDHEAYLVRLNDGVTAEDYLNTPPTEIPPATSLGGITAITPGSHQYMRVTLEPGNYALFCFFIDPSSHAPHFALGMLQEFTVAVTESKEPVIIVQTFYEVLNTKAVGLAMTLTADDYVMNDPFGTYDKAAAAVQWKSVVDAGLTFNQTNFVDTGDGRVTSCYEVFENGTSVDKGCDNVTHVRDGKIIFDGLLPAELIWIAQKHYSAMNAGDLETAMSVVADDVKCRGTCYLTGKASYQSYVQGTINNGGRTELSDFVVAGDKVSYKWQWFTVNNAAGATGTETMQIKDGKIVLIEGDQN